MESCTLSEFRNLTKELLDSPERVKLKLTLRKYKDDGDIDCLASELKPIICQEDDRQQLLPFIRMFLQRNHRQYITNYFAVGFAQKRLKSKRAEFDNISVGSRNSCRKQYLSTSIYRSGYESLGIGIRGGSDFGCGIFISEVHPDSPAARSGLQRGDQIISANGTTFDTLNTTSAARLLASGSPDIKLVFARKGIIPVNRKIWERMVWTQSNAHSTQTAGPYKSSETEIPFHHPPSSNENIKSFNIRVKGSLKFSLKGGSDFGIGIFVSSVSQDEFGDFKNELQLGNEIISVNGVSVEKMKHSAAIDLFKQQRRLIVAVKRSSYVPSCKEILSEITWISTEKAAEDDSDSFSTTTRSFRNEIPWESNITICPSTSCNRDNNSRRKLLSRSSSSASLVVDASNQFNFTRNNSPLRSSLVSFATTTFSISDGQGESRNLGCAKPPTPILKMDRCRRSFHEQSIGNNADVKGILKQYGSQRKMFPPSGFKTRVAKNQNKDYMETVTKLTDSTDFRDDSPCMNAPTMSVKGERTLLVKLPKKPDTTLGLGVSGGGESLEQCLKIDHALPDSIAGVAVSDGTLKMGSNLLAVDGNSLVGVSHDYAVSLIRRCFRDSSKSTLNLLLSVE